MADIETIPSVEEVDAGVPGELEHYEIVDGQVAVMASTSDPHQHVLIELGYELTAWARQRGAVVRSQTFDVRTSPEYWCFDTDTGQVLVAAPPDAAWRTLGRGQTLTSTTLPGFAVPLDRVLPPPA